MDIGIGFDMIMKVDVNKVLILECLQELGDLIYQRRVWVNGVENEVSGLEDTVAALFDDSALDIALKRNEETFSFEIDAKFRKLSNMIDMLNRDRLTAEIIETEEWGEVMLLADSLYKSFNFGLTGSE
ncbi:MAG: hypothetical protein RPU90_15220 [Candidatus Sedimenticola sp. (ex Thyasira tokunagai)]